MKWTPGENGHAYAFYRGVHIRRIFPSGYYEFFSEEFGQFLRYDNLDEIKRAIRNDLKHRQ